MGNKKIKKVTSDAQHMYDIITNNDVNSTNQAWLAFCCQLSNAFCHSSKTHLIASNGPLLMQQNNKEIEIGNFLIYFQVTHTNTKI